tara:strand:- start:230 stop:928 length:699 start_codon:yes stop_codon:yes gene_type:complete
MADLSKTMDAVAELHKSHGVQQKGGKFYTQVVHRMEAFRRIHGTDFGIDTQILVNDGKKVVVKAIITDKDNRTVGVGMAEEIRGQGLVNTTSALENAETSAIGRALASLGLAGGEYASANEMDAVVRKTDAIKETPQVEVKEQEESSTSNTSSPVPMSSDKMFDKINKHIQIIQRKQYKENKEQLQLEELIAYFTECSDTYFKSMDKSHVEKITKEFFRIEKELNFYIKRAK